MKIAMLGHKHMLSREGGIEIVVSELAPRMAARGNEITVYDRRARQVNGETADQRGEYKGVRIVPVWTLDRKGMAAMTSSFFAALRAAWGKYDVVHIHAEGPAAMCWIPKLHRKRVVVTIHGLDWARAKWGGFAARYIKLGEKQAVRHADEIIVLSRGVQEYFQREYGRETVFIPNGVNKAERMPVDEIRKLWGLEKDSYILFVGRIVPEKGLQYLVEAWKGIRAEKKLVIAGGSSDTDDFARELKEMTEGEVVFTGFQQGRILAELYSNAYLYVLPSDLEGMPLSLLEAMSYGNCCLVSDIPECTEVVGDKAAVFKHADVDALRNTMQSLLEAPERVQEYRKDAADYIKEKYNWDDVVSRTLELYGEGMER